MARSNFCADLVGEIPSLRTQFLKNGTTFNAIGDYSSAQTIFRIKPAIGRDIVVARLLWAAVGDSEMVGSEYGDLPELTNGVRLVKLDKNDDIIKDLTIDLAIKNNATWGIYCYDTVIEAFGAAPAAKDFWIRARWSFFKSGIPGIRLDGTKEESFAALLNDDFSALNFHTFQVQGYDETEWE